MRPALIDTDILSLFFRGQPNVVDSFEAYLVEHDKINLSILTYYEILSGLKHRDARKQMESFLDFASYNNVLPLTQQSVTVSADIYADLRVKGTPVDDIDILIAGIAIANDLVLVTRNRKHFDRIDQLMVEDWAQSKHSST